MSATRTATTKLEVVRAAFDAIELHDLEALADLLDDQVTFRPLRGAGRSSCRGRAAVVDLVRELVSGPGGWSISAPELRLLDDGVVAALGVVRAGAGEHPFAGLHQVRDGRLVDVRHYYSDLAMLRRLGIVEGHPSGS